jgi:hypothetical protein
LRFSAASLASSFAIRTSESGVEGAKESRLISLSASSLTIQEEELAKLSVAVNAYMRLGYNSIRAEV